MDSRGRNEILDALGSAVSVIPAPKEGEDVQFVGIEFEGALSPAHILNLLGKARLTGMEARPSGPNLKLIGQSYNSYVQRPGYQLTFEDLNHPNA